MKTHLKTKSHTKELFRTITWCGSFNSHPRLRVVVYRLPLLVSIFSLHAEAAATQLFCSSATALCVPSQQSTARVVSGRTENGFACATHVLVHRMMKLMQTRKMGNAFPVKIYVLGNLFYILWYGFYKTSPFAVEISQCAFLCYEFCDVVCVCVIFRRSAYTIHVVAGQHRIDHYTHAAHFSRPHFYFYLIPAITFLFSMSCGSSRRSRLRQATHRLLCQSQWTMPNDNAYMHIHYSIGRNRARRQTCT